MNEAHLHLIVNHFPITGLFFGFGILIAGLVLKNNSLKNTAFSLFIISALFAICSMATGEGAEELVEDLPDIGHHIIHEHEEIAEKLALLLYVLGLFSIYGFYLNIKNHIRSQLVSVIVLFVSAIGIVLALKTGTSGGEIRHVEIRETVLDSHIEKKADQD